MNDTVEWFRKTSSRKNRGSTGTSQYEEALDRFSGLVESDIAAACGILNAKGPGWADTVWTRLLAAMCEMVVAELPDFRALQAIYEQDTGGAELVQEAVKEIVSAARGMEPAEFGEAFVDLLERYFRREVAEWELDLANELVLRAVGRLSDEDFARIVLPQLNRAVRPSQDRDDEEEEEVLSEELWVAITRAAAECLSENEFTELVAPIVTALVDGEANALQTSLAGVFMSERPCPAFPMRSRNSFLVDLVRHQSPCLVEVGGGVLKSMGKGPDEALAGQLCSVGTFEWLDEHLKGHRDSPWKELWEWGHRAAELSGGDLDRLWIALKERISEDFYRPKTPKKNSNAIDPVQRFVREHPEYRARARHLIWESLYPNDLPFPPEKELGLFAGIDQSIQAEVARAPMPLNLILYGPPGTGKTYETLNVALEICCGVASVPSGRDEAVAEFHRLRREGRIEFVTFHQAYGYEEFVEGIRPVLEAEEGGDVQYRLSAGVFKKIALRAATEGVQSADAEVLGFDILWRELVTGIEEDGHRIAESQTGKTYKLELSPKKNIIARRCEIDENEDITLLGETSQTASKNNAQLYWDNSDELGPDPMDFSYKKTLELFAREKGIQGGNHYTALWIVYGELLALAKHVTSKRAPVLRRIDVVKGLCSTHELTTRLSFARQATPYVLIIDEINRGNISKILGELITLLEPDKRLGQANRLTTTLPYSQDEFGVPPNLYVIGTMNSADRSIAFMDTALRRRGRSTPE